MALDAVLRMTYSLRSSASGTSTSGPRPMNTCLMMGAFARTVGDIGMSAPIGTSRHPSQHLPFGPYCTRDFLHAREARCVLFGQEDDANAILAVWW